MGEEGTIVIVEDGEGEKMRDSKEDGLREYARNAKSGRKDATNDETRKPSTHSSSDNAKRPPCRETHPQRPGTRPRGAGGLRRASSGGLADHKGDEAVRT